MFLVSKKLKNYIINLSVHLVTSTLNHLPLSLVNQTDWKIVSSLQLWELELWIETNIKILIDKTMGNVWEVRSDIWDRKTKKKKLKNIFIKNKK